MCVAHVEEVHAGEKAAPRAQEGEKCSVCGGGSRYSKIGCAESAQDGENCTPHGENSKFTVPECKTLARKGGMSVAHEINIS